MNNLIRAAISLSTILITAHSSHAGLIAENVHFETAHINTSSATENQTLLNEAVTENAHTLSSDFTLDRPTAESDEEQQSFEQPATWTNLAPLHSTRELAAISMVDEIEIPIDDGNERISIYHAIPEPTTTAIIGIYSFSLLFFRRLFMS